MSSSWEKIAANGPEMDLYVSLPAGSGPFPAVVVAHHGGGVDQFVRDVADRLAEEGYATAAPDLFHRITEEVAADGPERLQHLSDPDAADDIHATVDFLRSHPSVDGERIGIAGFSVGGRLAWLAAATNPHLKAAVTFYGGDIMAPWGKATQSPFELADGIGCPILFHFGEIDENPSQAVMRTLDDELTRLGKRHQFYLYPGAGHAFTDPTAALYRKEATQVSWFRTLEFLARHLKGADAR